MNSQNLNTWDKWHIRKTCKPTNIQSLQAWFPPPPTPELASAHCHLIKTLGYLKLQKAFVAGWGLWKQMPPWSLRCSSETKTQEGKEAGLGRGRGWRGLSQTRGKSWTEYLPSRGPALHQNAPELLGLSHQMWIVGLSRKLQEGCDLSQAAFHSWGRPWRNWWLEAICTPQSWVASPSLKGDLGSSPLVYHRLLHLSSLVPHSNPRRWVQLFPFPRWGSRGFEHFH